MDAIVKMLEKHQPFFEKISRNIYLQAIKDGFLGCMPIVLTSSIFLLIATLPGVVGITLPQPLIDWCNKLYNFTMGVMGIMVAGTTAKNFTASMNRRMPAGKVLNDGSTMVAAQCSMLLLAVTQFTTKLNGSELSVFDCTSMGTRGLFSAYIAAFITVWVYKFCVSRDLTIKLPKEVPGAIAQNFRDIIPFGGAVIICGIIDVVVRNLIGVPFSELLIKLLSPLFTAAETYPGLILIQAATAFFWFIGVHGPSIVEPAIAAALVANMTDNLAAFQAGQHASAVLTQGAQYFVVCMGGTGATLVLVFMFCFLAKSQEMRAVGKAAIVPVCFAVNEPLLFAAPIVLNPVFFVPFVFAPIANIWILKIFIDFLGMNGFMYTLPWTVPGPIGTIMGLGFQPLAFVMLILTNAILTGCAWASIARDRIAPRVFAFAASDAPAPTGKLARLRGAFVGKPLVAAVLCLLLAGVFALLGMEVSSNHDFTWVYPLCILLEWAIITALMTGLFFLLQRHGAAPAVLAFALFVLGIAEFFVITFKSMPIQPGDLSAISTAAAVAGTGYTFSISLFCVLSMGFTAIAMLLCEYAGLVAPHRQKGAANAKRMLLTNLLVAVLCLGGVTAHVTLIDYYNTLGITVYTWRPLESYWREGYLPAFISAAQSIKPPKPAGYSVDDAKATLKKYAKTYDKSDAAKSDERTAAKEQFDSEKPTVIAIMNETFSDLSIYQNMRAGYEGPQYFKSLSNCLSRGKLYVSAYGGGTANTEFEFLTGNSMNFLPSGSIPYQQYILGPTDSLATLLKGYGYETRAFHPGEQTSWQRNIAYPRLGFNSFKCGRSEEHTSELQSLV